MYRVQGFQEQRALLDSFSYVAGELLETVRACGIVDSSSRCFNAETPFGMNGLL